MSLSEISIRRPVFAWMLMAAIMVFGVISFSRLGISQLPDVDFPVVSVSLSLPGAAPEIMESQVLDPVEDAIMEMGGIRSLNSKAQQSSGSISVEFEMGRNIDEAIQEIQGKINQVRNLLPNNLRPPTIRKSNPEDQPILWLALTSDDPNTPPIDMMIYARNFLFNQFSTVTGVGDIALGGFVNPSLRVWADLNKLDYYNLTSDDVINAITSQHSEIPAGLIAGPLKEYNVRVAGEAATPEDFGKISINTRQNLGPNYQAVRISDVATVVEGVADVRRISRFNGKRAVGLGIVKQHGANAVEVAQAVRERLEEIKPMIKAPYHVDLRNDNTRFIKQSVDSLLFTLALSALLTSIVCYLFLGSWSSTMNVLLAIPTSIVGTFIAFYFFNFTLNTFTLLGLSLAIGIIVDDAIMMLENIVRHMEKGMKRKQAALTGSKEITFAAIAATLAIVAIFLPVVFMKGIIGRYFLQYGITVTIAVLLSLLEALTLTPMRCSRYLTVDENPKGLAGFMNRLFAKLNNGYEKLLRVLLRHRWKTIVVATILFLSSFLIAKQIPSEMMPAQDQSMFMLRFKLPVGTSLKVTDEKIKLVEKYLLDLKEVDGVFSVVGGFGGDSVNQGMAYATLVPPKERKMDQAEIIQKVRKELKAMLKDVQVNVQDLSLRGFSASRGFPIEFIVQGENWTKLSEATKKIMDEMNSSGAFTDVNTDVQEGMPEIRMIPNKEKMSQRGVSLKTVTNVLNSLVGGAILNGQTSYSKAGHRYEIGFRLKESQRDKIPDLKRIQVRNNRGQTVRLSDVVDQKIEPNLMLISRLNRARAITVYGNPAPGHSQKEAMKEAEEIVKKNLPQGYFFKISGTSQSFGESFNSLFIAMALGILVAYMVLASQFNSFIHPVTVLMALPFSFSGAFLGLYLAGQSINMYSLIGFILLMGIVKKNSILLVDFTNHTRVHDKLDVNDALLKACPIRLRPIMMTSIATIAGAIPEALHLGPGSETAIPMAVAIIGGVAVSTVLTLLVVPCVYSLFSKLERPEREEDQLVKA